MTLLVESISPNNVKKCPNLARPAPDWEAGQLAPEKNTRRTPVELVPAPGDA